MPLQILPIRDLDKGGLVMDSDSFSLTPIEYSDCKNVRFADRSVSKIEGEESIRTLSNTDVVSANYWRQPTIERYVYHTDNGNSYLANATGTDSNITGTTNLGSTGSITGGFFNGGATYLVSRGGTIPQYINATGFGAPNTQQTLQNFPAWDYDSAIFTSVIPTVVRAHRNVIIAANLTYTRTNNQIIYAPGTIRVSNLAARGEMPTWDPQLAAATTADEFDLATNDEILDLVPFQDRVFIYCDNSIHSLRLTGNTTIPVSVSQELNSKGVLSSNCAIEFYGRHFVVGQDDIYTYGGGATVSSVSDEKVRDYFYSNLNVSAKDATFCIHNQAYDEVWVCYPKGTSTVADEALIYNYRHNVWTRRDLPNAVAGVTGALPDDFTTPTQWERNDLGVVLATGTELIAVDRGTDFNGNAIDAYVERLGFDVDPNNDLQQLQLRSVYAIATGTGTLEFRVRASEAPGNQIDLTGRGRFLKVRNYNLDSDDADYKVDINTDGRYFHYRVGSNDTTSSWNLVELQLGVQGTARR